MRRHEGVEGRVVQYAEAGLVICQMVVSRLIIVIEDQATTSRNNSLGGIGHREATDLIQRAVEGLYCRKGTDVPDAEHTGDIS